MNINRTKINDVTLLELDGNLLGEKDSLPIMDVVQKSIEGNSIYLVLDAQNLKYINSTGLSVLLTMQSRYRNAGGDIVIINTSSQLSQILDLSKLTDNFNFADNLDAAILILKQ